MLAQEGINTAVQLVVVMIIALVVWALAGRRKASFLPWIGLTVPPRAAIGAALFFFLIWAALNSVIYVVPELRESAAAANTVAGALRRQGFNLEIVFVILIVGGLKTALSEEILFRGLIAKRLINAAGFWVGNTLHAILFGAIHLLIFVVPGGPEFTPFLGAIFFLLPGGAGWLMAYVNERKGNGSIVPGWIIHALGNITAYPILAFVV